MNVLAGRDAGFGVVEQAADAGLDQDGLKAGYIQQLIPRQPLQAAICGCVLGLPAKSFFRLDNTDDLVVGGRPIDGQFARVGMTDSDLADLDAGGRGLGVVRS